MGLTCRSRPSEVKKKEKRRGKGVLRWVAFAGPVRSPGLGPVGLPKPLFSLKRFSFFIFCFQLNLSNEEANLLKKI
jgi:hypothetical protein